MQTVCVQHNAIRLLSNSETHEQLINSRFNTNLSRTNDSDYIKRTSYDLTHLLSSVCVCVCASHLSDVMSCIKNLLSYI